MECSLPFVMLPNKQTVEKCSTANFYIVFGITAVLTAIGLLIKIIRTREANVKAKQPEKNTPTYIVIIVVSYLVIMSILWFGLRFLMVNGSVSSWEGYQSQAALLMKTQGMSKSQALQAIQNQRNTRNIETDIALNSSNNNGVIYI